MALDFLDGRQLSSSTNGMKRVGPATGTAAPQTIAHGLGYTPTVLMPVWANTGTWTWSALSADDTNITITAGNTCVFYVLCW